MPKALSWGSGSRVSAECARRTVPALPQTAAVPAEETIERLQGELREAKGREAGLLEVIRLSADCGRPPQPQGQVPAATAYRVQQKRQQVHE